tara:strand:- start:66 stop:227 length:162 start_codon:yes stop_codon:yes gene_type:complete
MPGHYPKPPKPKAPPNPFDEQNTKDAAGKPLPGTGSRYDKHGKKIELGVGWGP